MCSSDTWEMDPDELWAKFSLSRYHSSQASRACQRTGWLLHDNHRAGQQAVYPTGCHICRVLGVLDHRASHLQTVMYQQTTDHSICRVLSGPSQWQTWNQLGTVSLVGCMCHSAVRQLEKASPDVRRGGEATYTYMELFPLRIMSKVF